MQVRKTKSMAQKPKKGLAARIQELDEEKKKSQRLIADSFQF